MATVAELRQLLKEDANGQNLYEHLTQVLMRILVDRPKNAFENFELISADVKANPLTAELSSAANLPQSTQQVILFASLILTVSKIEYFYSVHSLKNNYSG